jgi:hypothetical protein
LLAVLAVLACFAAREGDSDAAQNATANAIAVIDFLDIFLEIFFDMDGPPRRIPQTN